MILTESLKNEDKEEQKIKKASPEMYNEDKSRVID